MLRHVRLAYSEMTHVEPAGGVFVQSNVTGVIDRRRSTPTADASVSVETTVSTFAPGSVSA